MLLTQTVAPSAYPITLSEAKDHLRIDGTDSDTYVTGLLIAASEAIQEMTGRALMAQTWAASVRNISCDFSLPIGPVQSITSITYYDADDVEQTATTANFYLFKDEDKATLRPKAGFAWPVGNGREDGITVTFVAGFASVPETIKHAIKLMVGHWHEHREAVSEVQLREVPMAVQSLVNLTRMGWVGA